MDPRSDSLDLCARWMWWSSTTRRYPTRHHVHRWMLLLLGCVLVARWMYRALDVMAYWMWSRDHSNPMSIDNAVRRVLFLFLTGCFSIRWYKETIECVTWCHRWPGCWNIWFIPSGKKQCMRSMCRVLQLSCTRIINILLPDETLHDYNKGNMGEQFDSSRWGRNCFVR